MESQLPDKLSFHDSFQAPDYFYYFDHSFFSYSFVDKSSPYHANPAPKVTPVNVVMTRTALLREKQNKALKSKQANKPGKKLVKHPAQSVKNIENICANQKTKTATISAGYDRPTKSSTVKTKSNQGLNSSSIKTNTLKNSKSFNSSNQV